MTFANLLPPGRSCTVESGAQRRHPDRRGSGGWILPVSLALALVSGLSLARSTLAQITPESLIGGAVSDKGPYYQDLGQAIVRFRAGDVDAARALLAAARNKAPKLSPVEVMLASMFIDIGQTAAARAELEKAVHLHPRDPEAYVRLAELDAADGRATEAGLLYGKASDLADGFNESPKRRRQVQVRALSGAAVIAESRAQWNTARDYLQALARVEPDNAALLQRLAKALFKLGEVDDARRALEAANAADNQSIPADLALAALYNQSGDRASAEKCIESLLEKGGDSMSAQIGLARWMLQAGELDKAQLHAQKAQQLEPDSLEVKVVAGVIARRRKEWDAAQALLEEAHLRSPLNVDANNQLALILIEQPDESNRHRATEFAELNQRLYPNNVEVVATLAWVFYHQDRKIEAERLFSAIATALVNGSAPVSGDSIYYLANVRADQGRNAEARRLLAILLKRDVPGLYRQEAEELLARLGGPEKSETPTEEPAADDTETPDKTKTSADGKATGEPSPPDAKAPIKP